MSKIGNYIVGLQESDDYAFGWESAERGEPEPDWPASKYAAIVRLGQQCEGWKAYHNEQVQP